MVTIAVVALSYLVERMGNVRGPMRSRADFIRSMMLVIGLIVLQGLVLAFDLVLLIPSGMGLLALAILLGWCVTITTTGLCGVLLFRRYRRIG
jgi:uncharacterized phage infection (PIP) family protein YhgE